MESKKKDDYLEIPGKGTFQQVSFQLRTWEGDRSGITLTADGKIHTFGQGHSGYGGEYGSGSHEYGPVPKTKVAEIVKLLSRPGVLVGRAQESSEPSKSVRQSRTVTTSGGSFDITEIYLVERAVKRLYEESTTNKSLPKSLPKKGVWQNI